jgi:hypothetical protein
MTHTAQRLLSLLLPPLSIDLIAVEEEKESPAGSRIRSQALATVSLTGPIMGEKSPYLDTIIYSTGTVTFGGSDKL